MMFERTILVDGYSVPRLLYGTAWKEDDTTRLVELAIRQGFRGIDTANQRKHYHEAAVGAALRRQIAAGVVTRAELFLQSKFTFRAGQDERLPYDAATPIAEQVHQSFASTLAHLGTDYLDSLILHGPSTRSGLAAADWAAWRAMEEIHKSGRTRFLGVSNVNVGQLTGLWKEANVRPRFVQNRCFAAHGWDRAARDFCATNQIVYQGFSLLTANRWVLEHAAIARMAESRGCTRAQIVFAFALAVGMIPLTGTSDPQHMQEDLDACAVLLEESEIVEIDRLYEMQVN